MMELKWLVIQFSYSIISFNFVSQDSCQPITWEDSDVIRFATFHFLLLPLSLVRTHREGSSKIRVLMHGDIEIVHTVCPFFTISSPHVWLFVPSIKPSQLSHFLHHSAHCCLALSLSLFLMSPISVPQPSYFLARCLWFTFQVFAPPAAPVFHPHTPTSSSLFLHLSLSLCFVFFLFLLLPLFLLPPPVPQISVFAARAFISVRPTESRGGGCNVHSYHPVTLPFSLCEHIPAIVNSAGAFWDPSLPPALISKSPPPSCVSLQETFSLFCNGKSCF